jgi:hypothetical protein
MKQHPLLRCDCQSPYSWQDANPDEASVRWLSCQQCRLFIPVINDFALFTEAQSAQKNLPEALLTLFSENINHYPRYLEQKKARNVIEIYAALQPFNEATRVLFPLVAALQQSLQPGDLILNCWDRTGWHSLLLSSLFPHQRIISIWDSNSSVLGYAGYDWWFSKEKRPANLDVIFLPANTNLPFATDSVALIFAHDVLHRYPFADYPDEIERVCQSDGLIIYAHVHLSNSEPEPWFQRGGTLRSSEFYRNFFSEQLRGSSRAVKVVSEAALFNLEQGYLEQAVDDNHYNGTIIVAQQRWLEQRFETRQTLTPEHRCLVNPLLMFNPFNRNLVLNRQGLAEQTEYFLERHQCLQSRLLKTISEQLSQYEAKVLLAAQSGESLAVIATTYNWPINDLMIQVVQLQQRDVLLALPLTQVAVELQRFHHNDYEICPANFTLFWHQAEASYPRLILEGEELSYQDITLFIMALAAWLIDTKLDTFDKLYISAELKGSQRILLLFACWWLGILPVLEKESRGLADKSRLLNPKYHNLDMNHFWPVIEQYMGYSVEARADKASLTLYEQAYIEWHQLLLELVSSES